MFRRVLAFTALVAACEGSAPDERIMQAASSEVATVARPAPRRGKPSLEDTVRALVDPTRVAAVTGAGHAVRVAWTDGGEVLVLDASCRDEAAFARAVSALAASAARDLGCDGAVCFHRGEGGRTTAFVFRADGTLEGVLDNVEAGDVDEAIAALHQRLALTCPARG
jgi:hypothetical protein